ncbi:glycerol-3-phosphate phosphatase [Cordyceps fumosorosea ARSEF 2679]|uniref:Glycerol-3-phosphate phosphatase n=1 Tax=Cordyceps fumosorosea (strain ARSEF 2679) TaxID=1081104 RepID=A0A167XCR6_CORFA|nr:glycerol-3-phosphate phosphatase [Cordyceps fumosorosea ARSEF 2679]OAA64814.1 glycerol-3-phosphate phosphatase [Cordyceps fumosorosea ARSEF 2679]
MGSQPDYSQPPLRLSFAGFLWDMDGTIIDSTPAIEKHWHTIGNEIGVDPETILKTSHGRRSIDTLKILAPERANWEYVAKVEGQLPVLYAHLATEIPGARALLDGMIAAAAPWAIVTSGTEPLVHGWLGRMKLAVPEHLVTAESVPEGKPDPACYRMGLDKLRLADVAGEVLVLEDSPAGIRAGKAAGCKVLGLVTSHTAEQVAAAEPDWIVKDLTSVRVVGSEGGRVTIEIKDGLKL